MNKKIRLVLMLSKGLSRDDLTQIGAEIVDEQLNRMSQGERVVFLREMFEEHMAKALAGLDSPHRAQLMNALLPLVARHFPLEEVDILGAFADSEDLLTPEREGRS